MSDHVRSWAEQHDFEVEGDSAGNLVVRVPASEGRESAPKITLQGHLDMVCEREPDSPNDPAEGRIELARDGDWLTANGTTLGADDGVAIAAMMALVEDESNLHGPLELLMTVAEEVGLEGANGLDPKLVTGTVLVNLDSEEDGKLTVGCAGSTDTWIHVEKPRDPAAPDSVTLSVTASGGLGGHSGSNIALGRANAIKVLGRVLREAYHEAPFRLVSLNGGKSRNAIRAMPSPLSRSGAAGAKPLRTPWRARSRPSATRSRRRIPGRPPPLPRRRPHPMPGARRQRQRCSTSSHSSRPGLLR